MIRRMRFLGLASALVGAFVSVAAAAELKDIRRIEELQALFNQDAGTPRVILLMSPT
jgi:hypothetical protein